MKKLVIIAAVLAAAFALFLKFSKKPYFIAIGPLALAFGGR